jgi:hypothetical protein
MLFTNGESSIILMYLELHSCGSACLLCIRALLGCNTSQLCKSMLMENTAWQPTDQNDDGSSASNSRFYLVVLQYVVYVINEDTS